MQSTTLLAAKLSKDFPDLRFVADDHFRWSPDSKVIYFDPHDKPDHLLHELSHALLGHTDYIRDIQLIEMECDAWEHAKQSSAHYGIALDDNEIQDALDTYRDWLHARSICPTCSATGMQTKKYQYKCLVCQGNWKVNDARVCTLRRYKLSRKLNIRL